MRLHHSSEHVVHVALSRRNLVALLTKLEDRTRPPFPPTLSIHEPDRPTLVVIAEPDDVHYSHPSRQSSKPGPMSAQTERDIESFDIKEHAE